MTKESAIEKYLREQVKLRGGRAIKLDPTGNKGIPDRLVVLPGGHCSFVELKRPVGGRLAPAQTRWIDWLIETGQGIVVLSTKAEVDSFLGAYDAIS